MKIPSAIPLFAATLLLSTCALASQNPPKHAAAIATIPSEISLDGADWTLTSFAPGDGEKNNAFAESFSNAASRAVTVPGEVQPQLGLKGSELFQESKELSLINNQEWWYRKIFASPAMANGKYVRVVFDGADYFTAVWINGHKLGEHEGSFSGFEFDITPYLKKTGANTLAVRVTHPLLPKDRGLSEYLKGAFTQVVPWLMTMKDPPYSLTSSWDPLADYGNATYAMGLWRGVNLKIEDAYTIHDLDAQTDSLNDDGSANLTVAGTVRNDSDNAISRTVRLATAPKNFEGQPITLPDQAITIEGRSTAVFKTAIKVAGAHLWWTWDMGKQEMYELTGTVGEASSTSVAKPAVNDTGRLTFGIRTIRRDADMTYYLNGKRIFPKGAWYPIADYYTSRVTPDFYRRDLTLFKYANFNSIVNFTIVEKPEFYDLCDELGIVIMVELPIPQFGPQHVVDTGSPRRTPYIATSVAAIRQIVTGLRNHPSIIEWVPLAESHSNAAGWGVDDIPFDQSGYQEFVDGSRDAIQEVSPHTIFQASFCDLGEHHFWTAAAGMTFNEDNYQDLFDSKAAFISEYGSNSLSSYQNLGRYLTPEQQWLSKPADRPSFYNVPIDIAAYSNITSFQYTGIASILDKTHRFVDQDIRSAKEFVDDSQLYHSFVVKYGGEAFRRKKYNPINGIRLWSFVELNPGFHFTIVDYDRVPKVGYWALKQLQAPLTFSFAFKKALESIPGGSPVSIPVWAVNDYASSQNITLNCEIYDLQSHILWQKQFRATLAADSSAQVGTVEWTTPVKAGVYLVRGAMTAGNNAATEPATNTAYLKVTTPALQHPHRVLLIAQRKFGNPIADALREFGVQVDYLDEDSLKQIYAMNDGAALHAKYDVIWLGPFESFWKVLTNAPAPAAIADAVKAGTAFIHTGGTSSFHGGYEVASVISLTGLADILPVQISDRIDLVLPALTHAISVKEWASKKLNEIEIVDHSPAWRDTGYVAEGLEGFNKTTLKPGSTMLWSVYGAPLLASGTYGQGRTLAFTGFTPANDIKTDGFLDEQLVISREAEAFAGLVAELISAATNEPLTEDAATLRAEHEKPLYQTLKEMPATDLSATIKQDSMPEAGVRRYKIEITNGAGYAHLVRLNLDDAQQHNPALVAMFSDSYFDLLPGEHKTVLLDWKQLEKGKDIAPILQVEATNAAAINLAAHAE
jgi:beta-mannosidase